MFVRRAAVVAVSTLATLALSTGAASAHVCFFNDPNPNGNAGRTGSNGFVQFGLCPAGVQVLADAAGVETTTLINAHGVMAGPTDGNKAIGHLDFAAIEAAFPAAAAACA